MLFVYGTLQDPDILYAVLGRPVDVSRLRPALAPFYRAVPYPGRVYPALVPALQGAAIGLLLTDLTDADMTLLDAFEGEEYRRTTIMVEGDGFAHQAQAYMPSIDIAADGPDWSFADWRDTHKPHVLATETATARSMRDRLTAQHPRQ